MIPAERRAMFRSLHDSGTFVMPNPFDVGTTRLLTTLGFPALATTSSGFAASLGRLDMRVTRDELVAHVAAVTSATDLPVNVDSERLFGDDEFAIAETVGLLADAGAAGCSIEDWNPATGAIDPIGVAAERVAAAASACRRIGVVLTARCENHIRGVDDLDDTITRLRAYRDAGGEVVFAPGLQDVGSIERVVTEVGLPVNVLALPGSPSVAELGAAGARRISVGGAMARIAYGAVAAAAQRLAVDGIVDPTSWIDADLFARAFTR